MFTTRPEILGTFGVVTSTHWLASATGMAILEKGGNAFDAAVATGFALQVVEPHLNGPGGEVPMLLYSPERDEVEVICGQGTAPEAATIEAYRDLGLDLVPGTGLLAAVVPGAFDAWLLLLRDYGTLPLAEVLGPAIALARSGYPLVPGISATIERVRPLFEAEWPSSAAVYLPGGAVPQPGSLFRNPALADTYARILEEAAAPGRGREAQIEAARARLVQGLRRRGDRPVLPHAGGDGHLRPAPPRPAAGDDLAGWQATVEAPLTYDYHGFTLCKPGPWSQAPVALQQLALLEGFDLAALSAEDPEFVHLATECAKLAFADREAFYGDPDFVEVPLATLLSDALQRRAARAGRRAGVARRCGRASSRVLAAPSRCTPTPATRTSPMPARWATPAPWRGRADRAARRDGAEIEGRGDTCHLDVIDRHGNMIAVDAVGRLAAELAGDPGARLLPQHARADVLAGGGPAREPGARQAAAHHAVALAWRCATASPTWCSARRAATSRTSGRCTSSCATSISA